MANEFNASTYITEYVALYKRKYVVFHWYVQLPALKHNVYTYYKHA